MSDFSEGEDDVFIKYEAEDNSKVNDRSSDEEEIDVAAVERWVPLGEEKESNESNVVRNERLVYIFFLKLRKKLFFNHLIP